MQVSGRWYALSHAAAVLVAVASGLGVFTAFPYARESASWAAQGVGQDLVNLFIVVPVLVFSAEAARRHSHRASALWAGALVYTVYSYVLYAFFVHFGPLFPVYVAILGLSGFALVGAVSGMQKIAQGSWPHPQLAPWVGRYLITVGVGFALLWLSDIVPALLAGNDPASLADTGFWVNPIHVLDLAFVLPAMISVGVLVLRRHPHGLRYAASMAWFSVLMGLAIIVMMLVMRRRGLPTEGAVAAAMGVVSALSLAAATVLWSELPARSSRLAAVGALIALTASCASVAPIPFPVVGARADVEALAGEWRGEYRSDETGR